MDHLRAVQFPEAGEGVQLIFRNRDILTLRQKYGENYLEIVEKGLHHYDMEVIQLCLAVAGKDMDGKPKKLEIDDCDSVPIATTAMKLLDAYSLSANGRTFQDQLTWAKEQLAKIVGGEGAARPLLSPDASLSTSSDRPSGQE